MVAMLGEQGVKPMATRNIDRIPLSKDALIRLRARLRKLKMRWTLGKLDINDGVGAVLDAFAQAYERDRRKLSRQERTGLISLVFNVAVRASWIEGYGNGIWLRGKDLNLRPLGYEFNTGFGVVRPGFILQQVTRNWLHGSFACFVWLVSNLLAIGAAESSFPSD